MIKVHHLNNSRSQRILWLLEELELDYAIVFYQRDAVTNLAPPELESIHALGKSPMISDGDQVVIESGAIIDYLIRKHGQGRLAPAVGTPAHEEYLQWLHYGEGSAMLPLMLRMYTNRLPDGGAALTDRIHSELDRHLGYINQALEGNDWLVGNQLSGADIQLSFVAEIAPLLYPQGQFPWLDQFRVRLQALDTYKRALERGGRYDFGPSQ